MSVKASTSTLNKERLFSFLVFLQQAPIHSTHNSWRDTHKLNHHPPRSQLNTNSTDVKPLTAAMNHHNTRCATIDSTLERSRTTDWLARYEEGGRQVTWPRLDSYVCNYGHNSSQWFSHINFSFQHFTDKSFLSTTQIISVDYKWLLTFHVYYYKQNTITRIHLIINTTSYFK